MTSSADAACAREQFDARARAKVIAPFVEEETAIVVHIDLSRIALEPTLDILCRTLPNVKADFRPGVTEKIGEVLRAGVNELYVVTSLLGRKPPSRASYIFRVPPGADEAVLRKVLQIPEGRGKIRDGAMVFAINLDERQREYHPVNRPELTAAFEAAGDTAIQVLLIPPAYARRVIEEFMPQLPENLGNGPSTVLTRGVSWAAVGIDTPPQGSLRLVIQSADAQAADALRVKLADLLRLAGERKDVREVLPKFDAAAAMLAPTEEGDRLVLTLDQQNQGFEKLVSALTPPIEVMQARYARGASAQNLKHIALAMHNYYGVNKHFPLPASASPDGKPLLSWRVSILPFLDQDSLFKQFHLDEPWDSPHNRTWIDKMPAVYRHPVSKAENGRTNYLLPVGNGAAFSADKPTVFQDIKDGTSNTIMVVEVDDQHAAIWTKPDDWPFDPKNPAKGLGQFFGGSFNAAICDGSVRLFQPHPDPQKLRAMFTRAGGEVIEW